MTVAPLHKVDDGVLMPWFLLAIACLLDPFAIVLLLAPACTAPPARAR